MKKILSILFALSSAIYGVVLAQSPGYRIDFSSNKWTLLYSHSNYTITDTGQHLHIESRDVGKDWENFKVGFPKTDVSAHPFVYIKIKAEGSLRLELRLLDNNNKETNDGNPILSVEPQGQYQWLTLDYTGKFRQSWPTADTVDPRNINQFSILINGGGNPSYTGWVDIEEVIIGDSAAANHPYDPVVYQPKVNQLGYWTKAPKVAVIPLAKATEFYIVRKPGGDTAYTGFTGEPLQWPYSEEVVVKADFSSLQNEGSYELVIEGVKSSYPFYVSDTVFDHLLNASIKAFYYNRASEKIDETYGGIWARESGHPDTEVLIHPSAATSSRPSGTVVSCPRGWYDAGDYNKYVVPAGIALWQLLSSYEYFEDETKMLGLNIPESGNTIPDILDEAMWELEWLGTMQDPDDGGIYHKVTNAEFDPMIMPADATRPRYLVQKSTPAALNFAAMMAKASRLYRNYEEYGPEYCSQSLAKAEKAWDWALSHPHMQYDQEGINAQYEPKIVTGDYGLQSYNIEWCDEWFWACVELYLATGKKKYLDNLELCSSSASIINWANVEYLGVISIVKNKDKFPLQLVQQAQERLLSFGAVLKSEYLNSAYGISLGSSASDIGWNSNPNALNQAMVLLHAYEITGDAQYFAAAMADLDYVLGRNPVNYCFVTGFGANSPRHIHHRISSADGILDPVPGLLVNGPHNDYLNFCYYPTTIPAFTYLDDECSAATNEAGIYDYSAVVYAVSASKYYYRNNVLGVKKRQWLENAALYPNPSDGNFKIEISEEIHNGSWQLISPEGRVAGKGELADSRQITFSLSGIPPGIYVLSIEDSGRQWYVKVSIH